MMKRWLSLAACLVLAAPAAYAQSDGAAMSVDEVETDVYDSILNVSPAAGAMSFADPGGDYHTDFIGGFTLSWNIANHFKGEGPIHYGLGSGILYSPAEYVNGGDVYLVPLDAYAGIHITDAAILKVHAGGNMFFQDVPAVQLGEGTGDFEIAPNVGAELGYGFTGWGLTLRADWTMVEQANPFVAVLGATFPLG